MQDGNLRLHGDIYLQLGEAAEDHAGRWSRLYRPRLRYRVCNLPGYNRILRQEVGADEEVTGPFRIVIDYDQVALLDCVVSRPLYIGVIEWFAFWEAVKRLNDMERINAS